MNNRPSNFVTGLTCMVCKATIANGDVHTCPHCGVEGILDVNYDYPKVQKILQPDLLRARPLDHWRYRELLPLTSSAVLPHLRIGWTPVYDVPRLASHVGVRKLVLKDDGQNPTSSFKDRASSVGVLKAQEFGYTTVSCASTGNAASSLAGLAAGAGLRSVIFVPQRTPEPKITQLLMFGATVVRVKGTYEQAFDLCQQACQQFGWYDRSSGRNPFLVEGKKTAGLEIGEQLRDDMPDWVVVSVGDGCTIGGVGKGLREMRDLGITDRLPRLLGVQAEGARPLLDAFLSGKDLVPTETHTLADSIAVGTPRNWRRAIREVRVSKGMMVAVSDNDILDAMRTTARLAGVFGEPAGVACVAGLRKAVGEGVVQPQESAVAIITGNGLKDIQSAQKAVGKTIDIDPSLDVLRQQIGESVLR